MGSQDFPWKALHQCLVQSRYSGPVISVITGVGASTPTFPEECGLFRACLTLGHFWRRPYLLEKRLAATLIGPQVIDHLVQGHLDSAAGPQPCFIACLIHVLSQPARQPSTRPSPHLILPIRKLGIHTSLWDCWGGQRRAWGTFSAQPSPQSLL